MARNATSEQTKADAERRRASFLAFLRGDPEKGILPLSVRRACDAVGVNRRTVETWRAKYPDFAEDYAEAMEDSTDVLDDEAVRRAVQGVPKGIYHMGERVATEQQYSDSLLTFILAGRRPERYGRSTSINVDARQQTLNAAPTQEQVARALALMLAEAQAQKTRKLEERDAS